MHKLSERMTLHIRCGAMSRKKGIDAGIAEIRCLDSGKDESRRI